MKPWRGLVRIVLVIVPEGILVAVVACLLFFGVTEQGLETVVRMAVDASGGMISIDKVRGRLATGWELEGLRVETVDALVSCRKMKGRVLARALWQGTMRLAALRGEGLDILIKDSGQATSDFVLPDCVLPMAIILDRIEVQEVFIHDDSGWELPRIEHVSMEVSARGDQIRIHKAEAMTSWSSLHFQGSMGLGNKWPLDWQGGLVISESGLGAGVDPVVADFVVSGTASEPVAQIAMQTPAPTTMHLAIFDLFNDIHWQAESNLAQIKLADLFADWPALVASNVFLKVSGDVNGYQGAARCEGLVWDDMPQTASDQHFPQIPVDAELTGDSHGLKVSSLVAKLPDEAGQVSLQGLLDWQEGVRWQFTLTGNDIDPQAFFPDWHGRMNATVSARGQAQGDDFSAETELVSLTGELHGYPLSGGGSLSVDNKGVQVREMRLQSGKSRLSVSGEAGSALDLQARLESENLGNLLPGASGIVRLRASLQGDRSEPRYSFELAGSNLSYQENQAQSLTGEGKGVISRQGGVAMRLAGSGLQHGSQVFSSFLAELSGTVESHQLQAQVQGAPGNLNMMVAGRFTEKNMTAWQGEIQELFLRMESYGNWQLHETVPALIDQGKVEMGSICLRQGAAKVCGDGGWQISENNWQVNVGLDSFATDLLYQWRLLSHPVTGMMTGSLRLRGNGGRMVSGVADMRMPELRIPFLDEEDKQQFVQWTDNQLYLELMDSKLVGMARVHFQTGGSLDSSCTIDHFGDLSASWRELPLRGEIGLDIKELGAIASLLNSSGVARPSGALQGRFSLAGQTGSPQVNGELRQTSGSISFPAAGITVEDLRLQIHEKGEGQGMGVLVEAASGPGKIAFTGVVARKEGEWQLDGTVTGHDFAVAGRPEVDILIDPDLNVKIRDGVVLVGGKVRVPHAFVAINTVDESVTVSRDVRIMDAGAEEKKVALPLRGSVLVELGDEVSIDSFGLQGQVQGSVTVSDLSTWPLGGKGELLLQKGSYVIKDRVLDISRGRFFFLGGPLSNPGIDVLAQKKVKNKVVGVLVSGTVNDMDLKLFSDPPMPENQILTELLAGQSSAKKKSQNAAGEPSVENERPVQRVVGNIFSQLEDQFALNTIYMESGSQFADPARASDISVMIGREVFTDLFISYGYDPFRAAGIFRARYDLWKGFSVETELGADQTGADLLWSIEK